MKTPENDETIQVPHEALVGGKTATAQKKQKPRTLAAMPKESPKTLIRAYAQTGECFFCLFVCLFVCFSSQPQASFSSYFPPNKAVTPPSAETTLPGILLASRERQTPESTGRVDNPTYLRELQPISDLDKFLEEGGSQEDEAEDMEQDEQEEEEEEEEDHEVEEEEGEEDEEADRERSAKKQTVVTERKMVNERQKRRVLERLRRIQEDLDDDNEDDEMKADYVFNVYVFVFVFLSFLFFSFLFFSFLFFSFL